MTALVNLLKRGHPKEFDCGTRALLEDITKKCKACEKFASIPAIFKVSMPAEAIQLNHEIDVDLYWIHNRPVLHIINRGTRYSVTKFLHNESAENFETLLLILGLPYLQVSLTL